jgi:SPP1 gp7 family putative phage head morphogenesis protein
LIGWDADTRRKDAADDLAATLRRIRVQTHDTIDASERDLERAADETSSRVARYCSDEFKRVFSIPTRGLVPDKILDGFRKENVSLVRNMADEELDKLGSLLAEADEKGLHVSSVAKMIEERIGVASSRAELIARDQILTLNGKVARYRQEAAGISRYTWNTTSDDRVRPIHEELHGTDHAWDDPPVINEKGDTGHPGDDIQCRCIAIPILPWLEGEEPEE